MSARPDLRQQRYDRQLRLWQSSGQSALENASVLVIGATCTTAATLKNLVLPGVGSFTLVDPQLVEESDIGSNFFLTNDSLGKPRAEEVSKYISELNPLVTVVPKVQKLSGAFDLTRLRDFNLVIVMDDDHKFTLELGKACWDVDVPLLVLQTHGFYSSIRLQAQEVPFIETHPDSFEDLRLDSPFPDLVRYSRTFERENMDSMEHAHIPFVAILVNALQHWKVEHKCLPRDFKERNQLKAYILRQKLNSEEDNFDEAVKYIFKACTPTSIPPEIQALFDDEKCNNVTEQSSLFWIMVRALRDFVDDPEGGAGKLPLHGSIPDMKSETKAFVELQEIYKSYADSDFQKYHRHMLHLMQSLERKDFVDQEVLRTFVRHSRCLVLVRTASLDDEEKKSMEISHTDELEGLYAALRIANKFNASYGRYPTDKDMEELGHFSDDLSQGHTGANVRDFLAEILRSNHCELPQIASLLGGFAAQEAIKLITRQYVPISGTCVFDGVGCKSGVFT